MRCSAAAALGPGIKYAHACMQTHARERTYAYALCEPTASAQSTNRLVAFQNNESAVAARALPPRATDAAAAVAAAAADVCVCVRTYAYKCLRHAVVSRTL